MAKHNYTPQEREEIYNRFILGNDPFGRMTDEEIRIAKEVRDEKVEARSAALYRQRNQKELTLYFDLTISKIYEYYDISGAHRPVEPEYLADNYDVDSPEDFYRWSSNIDHLLDINYAIICLIPRFVGMLDGHYLWYLELFQRGGDCGAMMLEYLKRYQDANVSIYIRTK